MFDQKIIITEQFPIPEKVRKHTDVCCTFIGAGLALFLFITALIVYSPEKYAERFSLPTIINECQGSYLHFPQIQNGSNIKACVNVCPQNYGATQDNICIPYNPELQSYYFDVVPVLTRRNREGFTQTLLYTIVVTFGIGIVWMILVFAIPKHAPKVAGIGAVISLSLILVFTALSTEQFWGSYSVLKLFPIVVSAILIVIIAGILFCYSNQLKFQGIMLKYSNIFLFQNPSSFIYLPIFLIFTFGLLALIWFQNMAFQSRFASDHNSLNYRNSGVLSYLNLIQLLWGLQFLRDSFNFCLSGNAVDWYWKGRNSTFAPFMRLICRNWGSVVGGSFLNTFFQIPTLLVELLTCHPDTCCSKLGTICTNSCNPITCFFEMVRTDAYSYINLSGIPFCNSARNCANLCEKSKQFVGNHSAIKHYRFIAFVFLTSLLCFMTQWILNYRTFSICPCNLAIGVVIIYGTIAWFIDIHTSSAQALQTCYLVEFQLQEGYKYMRKILPVSLFLCLEYKVITAIFRLPTQNRWKLLILTQLIVLYFLLFLFYFFKVFKSLF